MTATDDDRVATVLKQTQSIQTCSTSTLRLLKALLGYNDENSPPPTKIGPTARKEQTTGRGVRPAKRGKVATVEILVCDEPTIPCLSRNRRLLLATKTFNESLKILGEAARNRQHLVQDVSGSGRSPLKETQGRARASANATPQRAPVKIQHPQKEAKKSPSSSEDQGLRATVDCARIALRALQEMKIAGEDGKQNSVQLAHGALVLVAKLQVLGLGQAALRETLNLRVHLEEFFKTGQKPPKKGVQKGSVHGPNLSSCFELTPCFSDTKSWKLFIAFQLQCLRLVSLDNTITGVDLLSRLDLGNPSSLPNVVVQGAERELVSSEKAALELNALSQAITSVAGCQNDRTQNSINTRMPPDTSFSLQLLALKVQILSFRLAKHQLDLEAEIWTPFRRLIQIFGRKIGQMKMEHFALIKTFLEELATLIAQPSNSTGKPLDTMPSGLVVMTLLDLAETIKPAKASAQCIEELQGACTTLGGLPLTTYYCKVASVLLIADVHQEAIIRNIQMSIELLEKPLRGSNAQLEQLLLQASKLRKAAAAYIAARIEASKSSGLRKDLQPDLCSICITAIFAVLHVFTRYARVKPLSPSISESPQKISSCQPLLRSAQQALKSSLAAVQASTAHDLIEWEHCIAALGNCTALSESLNPKNGNQETDRLGTDPESSALVQVSNLYWAQYLRSRTRAANAGELARMLSGSIDALEGSSMAEKKLGFLAIKCERLSGLYADSRNYEKARKILAVALQCCVEDGSVVNAFQIFLATPVGGFCAEDQVQEDIADRMLTAFARLCLKCQPFSFLDSKDLTPLVRAFVLEKQFTSIADRQLSTHVLDGLKETGKIILQLYSETCQPAYLLRFIFELLCFCSRLHLDPQDFLTQQALDICRQRQCDELMVDDHGSSEVVQCLDACVLLRWAFQYKIPSFESLCKFVSCCKQFLISSDDDLAGVALPNPIRLISLFQSVVDFADMKGYAHLKLDGLYLVMRLLELTSKHDLSALGACVVQVGMQHVRMGQIDQADQVIAKADALLADKTLKTSTALLRHLSYAEYLTAVSQYDRAREELESAQCRFETELAKEHGDEQHALKPAEHKHLAYAARVAAKLALETRDLDSAIRYAKRSVKLSSRQWIGLEKLIESTPQLTHANESVLSTEGLTTDLSRLSISEGQFLVPASSLLKGAGLWPYVRPYFDDLITLSRLSAHCGGFQDAVYYAEQARKVAEKVQSETLLNEAICLLALHYSQSQHVEEGRKWIDSCVRMDRSLWQGDSAFEASLDLANALHAMGKCERAKDMVNQMQRSIYSLLATELPFKSKEVTESSSENASRKARPIKTKATRARKPKTKLGEDEQLEKPANEPLSSDMKLSVKTHSWIQKQQAKLDVLKCFLHLESGALDNARSLSQMLASLDQSLDCETWVSVIEATVHLSESLNLLESDPLSSILSESSIAYPSKAAEVSDGRKEEPSSSKPAKKRGRAPRTAARPKPTKQCEAVSIGGGGYAACLQRAVQVLLKLSPSLLALSPSSATSQYCALLTRLKALMSVLAPAEYPQLAQPFNHLDEPRALRWSREAVFVQADRDLSDKANLLTWPKSVKSDLADLNGGRKDLAKSEIQRELTDKMPSSWNVISVDLNTDQTELYVSRLQRGRQPFSLRLPLLRSNSEELDEERLDFRTAHTEMLEIIANANMTAHDSKGASDKQGKKEWWAAREVLDEQLEDLLINIENTWLGGFRGIFAEHFVDESILSRFEDALSRTLNRYLPSRGQGTSASRATLDLHPYILQLFVSLIPLDDEELTTAITDLVFFIVDMLQFRGERNAYDEIDFDPIVLELITTLRTLPKPQPSPPRHTILILSQTLHAFPWESLPFLSTLSISRMPNLTSLLPFVTTPSRTRINPSDGSYILNPSRDLPSTQSTFLPSFLTHLPTYTNRSITARPPTEPEFASLLTTTSLLLYFGHGSGAQFIRARTIRRLPRCATVFLMGCSSARTTTCGAFEPYGTPFTYLRAGAAAVVGTLWDVTDRDIDRFAMRCFVDWGLLETKVGEEFERKEGKRKKGVAGRRRDARVKSRVVGFEDAIGLPEDEKVALPRAVTAAREACVLRFLNGAAAVVYGVPVFLDK